jgi:hypothetical protein
MIQDGGDIIEKAHKKHVYSPKRQDRLQCLGYHLKYVKATKNWTVII